jgi:hypothetical protein
MFIFVSAMFFVGCVCTGVGIGYLAHKILDKIFGSK